MSTSPVTLGNLTTPSQSSQSAPLRAQIPNTTSVHLDHERMMDCIHCGLCLSQCPTYAEEGLEADSPRGRIYLMRTVTEGRAELKPSIMKHFELCLGCRACETACPSGVQYGHLIEGMRAHAREHYPTPLVKRLINAALENSFPYPRRLEMAMLPIRILRSTGILPLLHKIGFMKLLGYLGELERMLPPLPPTSIRKNFPERFAAKGEQQSRVGMFTGCVMQVMLSPVNVATASVLTKAGCAVDAPKTQFCCGALHAHNGALDEAKKLAKQNIEAYENYQKQNGELDAIIVNAGGCGAVLKEYIGWFKDEPEWAERARAFSAKVRDVSEFLAQPQYKERLIALMDDEQQVVDGTYPHQHQHAHDHAHDHETNTQDVARETMPNTAGASTLQAVNGSPAAPQENTLEAADATGQISPRAATGGRRPHDPEESPAPARDPRPATRDPKRMTYHDSCHLAHGQSVRVQPRELLEAVVKVTPGAEYVPLHESEMCCGSAGTYNILQPKMATQLLQRKMKNIEATGAKVVVSANPGCTLQLRMGANMFNVPIEVVHPVEVLDAATNNPSHK